MRPIVSYDDIAPAVSGRPALPPRGNQDGRRGGRGRGRGSSGAPNRVHWDDPAAMQSDSISYDESQPQQSSSKKKWEFKSRELTHEEIWDDSALVDAWDAAMEEYEACISLFSVICLIDNLCRH
jgi:hypothetical protein